MLRLDYDGDRAIIDNSGCVEYRENQNGAMVVTLAPSQMIMAMVLAVMPFVMTDVFKADARVKRLARKVQNARSVLENAENAECAARAELLAQLRSAEKSLQQEQSC